MPLSLMSLPEQFGHRIREKRRILKLKQRDLAELASTSQTAIARLESGRGNPTLEFVQRVADALELHTTLIVEPRTKPGLTPS